MIRSSDEPVRAGILSTAGTVTTSAAVVKLLGERNWYAERARLAAKGAALRAGGRAGRRQIALVGGM